MYPHAELSLYGCLLNQNREEVHSVCFTCAYTATWWKNVGILEFN